MGGRVRVQVLPDVRVERDRFAPPEGWPAPMRPEAFHGLPGAFVAMVEPHTEADRHGLLLQFLAATGNAIGRGPGLMAEGAFHPTVVWPVIVGASSKARKGTSWSRVRQVMELADPYWAAAKIEGGLSSAEGLADLIRDERRERRKAKKDEVGDADGMIEDIVDSGVPDKRICVVETEWAQIFKVLQREGNTLSIALRTLWDIGQTGTLTRKNPTRVTGGHCTVIGHCTIDEVRLVVSNLDIANGLINRFLFCCVRRTKELPRGGFVPAHQVEEFIAHLAPVMRGAQELNGPLEYTEEALELWDVEYSRLVAEHQGRLGQATSRAEAQVLRLSLLYAVLDGRAVVDVDHLKAALAVWDYCFASTAYVFGTGTGDRLADRILDGLQRAKAGMTRTQIRELVGNRETEDRIELAFDVLHRHELAVREFEYETGGRPAERWWATRKDER